MTTESLMPERLADANIVAIKLPADVAGMLRKEARSRHKAIAELVRELLQDQADAREAERRWKGHKTGVVKAVPAQEVYKRLGI